MATNPSTQDTNMSNALSSSVHEDLSTSDVEPQDTGFLTPSEREDYKRWRNRKIDSGSKTPST